VLLGIIKIDAGPTGGRIEFEADTNVDILTLVKLVQQEPETYGLEGGNRLKFKLQMDNGEQRFQLIERLLQQLTPKE